MAMHEEFRHFVARQAREGAGAYEYKDIRNCALAQFGRYLGHKHVTAGAFGFTFHDTAEVESSIGKRVQVLDATTDAGYKMAMALVHNDNWHGLDQAFAQIAAGKK